MRDVSGGIFLYSGCARREWFIWRVERGALPKFKAIEAMDKEPKSFTIRPEGTAQLKTGAKEDGRSKS